MYTSSVTLCIKKQQEVDRAISLLPLRRQRLWYIFEVGSLNSCCRRRMIIFFNEVHGVCVCVCVCIVFKVCEFWLCRSRKDITEIELRENNVL
jgi:hypothetical protein